MVQPSSAIARLCPDADITIHYNPNEQVLVDEEIQLLILQRVRICRDSGEPIDQNAILMEAAKKRGIPVIYEHDDNDYALPSQHGMYFLYRNERIADKIDLLFKEADAITTTTSYIAKVFGERSGNPNKVYVFPNCIDFSAQSWAHRSQNSRRLRIGWAGGSSHDRDLLQLRGVASTLYSMNGDRLQFMIGGYDTRGTYSYISSGQTVTRIIEAHETVWKDMVATYFDGVPKQCTRIMRTLPVDLYGYFFSQFDIGVVPLEDTEFSRSKSPLKLLEYGAYGVPVVASDVWPYRDMVGDDNAVKLIHGKNPRAWVDAVQELIDDPVLRQERGQRLRALVRSRYDEELWAPKRMQFWRDLVAYKTTGKIPERQEFPHA